MSNTIRYRGNSSQQCGGELSLSGRTVVVSTANDVQVLAGTESAAQIKLENETVNVTGPLRVSDVDSPFTYYVSMDYDAGNMILSPRSTSYDVVVADATSIRPDGENNITCGESNYPWTQTFSSKYHVIGDSRDYVTWQSKTVEDISPTTTPKAVTFNIPSGARLIGATAIVTDDLVGCTNWAVAYTGGSDAVIGTALDIEEDTEVATLYDWDTDGSDRVITDDTTNIAITTTGDACTAGKIRVTVFYETIGTG